jgi:DNA polymerase-3 subunit alpha
VPRKTAVADFVHLHNHSEYSLLDGASRIEEMVKLAAEYGMPSLAITDHGNLYGAIKFYKAAQKAGVKPIIGAEVYVAPGDRRERKVHTEILESNHHLTLLCRDEEGWRNLIKLVSLGFLEGFYYKPRIDKELLGRHSAGLVALSGCLKGEVGYFLNRGDFDRAMEAASAYQGLMGAENFYLEAMRSGLPEQEKIIPGLKEISAALDIPIVATNDCHYLRPDDVKAHDALVCIQTGKRMNDQNRLRMTQAQLHFRSPGEMAEAFADMPDAVKRTREVADRCNLLFDFSRIQFHLPRFEPPEGFADAGAYLLHLAREGLHRRYGRLTTALEERLNHELEVIGRMGFAGYFLVVKDIIDFARSSGIPVGPGRGSAAGSLVLYCLGITDIDPLRYGLLFERFLTTERVTLPDVDVDFADDRRPEVIEFIRKRYGEDSVAQIITFGTMQARAAVRDVGRVLDVPIGDVDRIAKLIPANMELGPALAGVSELRAAVKEKPEYEEMMAIARKLEGLNRHASIHASAVVITPRPLLELVPLYKSTEGDVCTQFDMYSLDDVGLLKMDVLGLRTLTVVEEATRLVRAGGGSFDPNNVPLDDGPAYRLVQKGETVGVFQLESAGMRDVARKMAPDRLEHIIAIISMYRPGPMDLIPSYLARKAGTERIEYEHELLEPICRETYGVLIYQEQVMQAAQALAGYSLGKADLLRRAMGKKKPEEMAAQHETFVEGCHKHNKIPAKQAERIFDLLAKFAGYGFNKSHAAGYAYLSYITAYLKANHPVEFLAATLTSELGDSKKLAKFVHEGRRMGLVLIPPDANRSEVKFSIEPGGIRFALSGIRNLGQGASEAIVKERVEHGEFRDPLDFLTRMKGAVNRKAVESMIKAGAFDWIDANRSTLINGLEDELARAGSERLQFLERQADLFGAAEPEAKPVESVFDTHILLAYEKDAFGFYFSSHPLEPYRAEYDALGLTAISATESLRDGTPVALGGVITQRRMRKDKRDREYVIITIEDFEGAIEAMVFSDQLEASRSALKIDNLVVVQGVVKVRAGDGAAGHGIPQVWANRVTALAECNRYLKALFIEVDEGKFDELLLLKVKERLGASPGQAMAWLRVRQADGTSRDWLLREYRVAIDNALLADLQRLVGTEAVRVKGELPGCNGNDRRGRYQGKPQGKEKRPGR